MGVSYPRGIFKDGKQVFMGTGKGRVVFTNTKGEFFCKGYQDSLEFGKANGLKPAPFGMAFSAVIGSPANVFDYVPSHYKSTISYITFQTGTVVAYPEEHNCFQKGQDFQTKYAIIPARSLPAAAFSKWDIVLNFYPSNVEHMQNGMHVFEADPASVEIIQVPKRSIYGNYNPDAILPDKIFPVTPFGFKYAQFVKSTEPTISLMEFSLEHDREDHDHSLYVFLRGAAMDKNMNEDYYPISVFVEDGQRAERPPVGYNLLPINRAQASQALEAAWAGLGEVGAKTGGDVVNALKYFEGVLSGRT